MIGRCRASGAGLAIVLRPQPLPHVLALPRRMERAPIGRHAAHPPRHHAVARHRCPHDPQTAAQVRLPVQERLARSSPGSPDSAPSPARSAPARTIARRRPPRPRHGCFRAMRAPRPAPPRTPAAAPSPRPRSPGTNLRCPAAPSAPVTRPGRAGRPWWPASSPCPANARPSAGAAPPTGRAPPGAGLSRARPWRCAGSWGAAGKGGRRRAGKHARGVDGLRHLARRHVKRDLLCGQGQGREKRHQRNRQKPHRAASSVHALIPRCVYCPAPSASPRGFGKVC
jgi:hypothetical protein